MTVELGQNRGSPAELVVARRPRPDGVPDPHPDDRTARGRRAAWSRHMVGGPRGEAARRRCETQR